MIYFIALLLALCGGYLWFRVVVALSTGVLRYKPRYQPERVVHFRGARREFLVMLVIFIVSGSTLLFTAAWIILHPSRYN